MTNFIVIPFDNPTVFRSVQSIDSQKEYSTSLSHKGIRNEPVLSNLDIYELIDNNGQLTAELCSRIGSREIPLTKEQSKNVWAIANQNPYLLRLLIARLAYYFDGQKQWLEPNLVETYKTSENSLNNLPNLWKVIESLRDNKNALFLNMAFTEKLTPSEFLFKNRLPINLNIVVSSARFAVKLFLREKSPSAGIWMNRVLYTAPENAKVAAAEEVLNSLSHKDTDPSLKPLRDWIRLNFAPGQPNTLWNYLSKNAQRNLRIWLGSATFTDFQNIIDLVIKKVIIHSDNSSTLENQLIKRRFFWSNYANQFLRLKILLPQDSIKNIPKEKLDPYRGRDDIGEIKDLGENSSEVCIFDFGDFYIIEVFRGKGSEIRLLKSSFRLEDFLFKSNSFYLSELRALPYIDKHDHAYLWQPFAERMLHKHNINPNDGLTKFMIDQNYYQKYSIIRGLDTINPSKLSTRESSLKSWISEIENVEKNARLKHPELTTLQ